MSKEEEFCLYQGEDFECMHESVLQTAKLKGIKLYCQVWNQSIYLHKCGINLFNIRSRTCKNFRPSNELEKKLYLMFNQLTIYDKLLFKLTETKSNYSLSYRKVKVIDDLDLYEPDSDDETL